jgi:hypothetical protein
MSSERVESIEKKIDRDVAGAIALYGSPAGATTIAPKNLTDVMEFAKLMAISGPCVRPAFRGSPGACLAIALQAFRTGADPFAVANKAYITKSRSGDEQIAYEAQYIHAVLNTSGKLAKRLRPTYSGEGQTRKCTIIGHVVGEDEPLVYESPTIGAISVKNSPLWQGDPDQQLFYYSSRAWGRRHLPEVLLCMYTPDEIRGEVIDITPGPPAPRPRPEDYAEHPARSEEQTETDMPRVEVVDFFGETRGYATEEEAIEALVTLVGEMRSLASLEGLSENNPTLAHFPSVIEAYKDQKEALANPGKRQDRPAAGPPSDPARGATNQRSRSVAASTAEFDSADAGSSPAATATSADAPGQTEHPSDAAPRDEPKQETEALRKLATAAGYLDLRYWTRKACDECRDPSDIDELSRIGEPRYKTLTLAERKEIRDLIDARNRQLSA